MTIKQNNGDFNNNQVNKEFNAPHCTAKRFIQSTCNNVYINDTANITDANVRHSFA